MKARRLLEFDDAAAPLYPKTSKRRQPGYAALHR